MKNNLGDWVTALLVPGFAQASEHGSSSDYRVPAHEVEFFPPSPEGYGSPQASAHLAAQLGYYEFTAQDGSGTVKVPAALGVLLYEHELEADQRNRQWEAGKRSPQSYAMR
jgi:hypothetical protein